MCQSQRHSQLPQTNNTSSVLLLVVVVIYHLHYQNNAQLTTGHSGTKVTTAREECDL